MELPIQYALSYPQRLPISGKRLDFSQNNNFTFFDPDVDRFPCLTLCIEAGKKGGTTPTIAMQQMKWLLIHFFF